MRGFWPLVAAMLLLPTLAGGVVAGCYAHTGTPPGPNCNADPSNPACYPPIHDQRKPR